MARVTIFKLHRLIRNLNKGEKRSFKLLAKKYNLNSDSSYLRLFDYLGKMETVDPHKFKEKFKEVKGLSGMQTYLYQQILKSLRSQETSKSIDLTLMEGLGEVEILYAKGLLEDTAERLSEVEALAESHQRILLLPLIYEWWFKIQNTRLRYDGVEEAELENYEKKYTEIFATSKEYALSRMQLGRIVFIAKRKYARQFPDLVQDIAKALPPYVFNAQKSVPGEIAALQLRAYLAAIMRNTKEAGQYHRYLCDFIKELPEPLHSENKKVYYTAMENVIINSKDIEQTLILIKDFEKIREADKKYLTVGIDFYTTSTQIAGYLSLGLLEDCRACIKKIPVSTDCPNKTISTLLEYQRALFYYADQQYDKALDCLNAILLDKNGTKSINLSSMLKIVILYEQGAYILLASYLNNVRRYFRKKEVLFEFDKRFISLMTKLVSLPQSEHQGELATFRTDIKAFLRTSPAIQGEFLLYFNYLGWLDDQIDQKAFNKWCFWILEHVEEAL